MKDRAPGMGEPAGNPDRAHRQPATQGSPVNSESSFQNGTSRPGRVDTRLAAGKVGATGSVQGDKKPLEFNLPQGGQASDAGKPPVVEETSPEVYTPSEKAAKYDWGKFLRPKQSPTVEARNTMGDIVHVNAEAALGEDLAVKGRDEVAGLSMYNKRQVVMFNTVTGREKDSQVLASDKVGPVMMSTIRDFRIAKGSPLFPAICAETYIHAAEINQQKKPSPEGEQVLTAMKQQVAAFGEKYLFPEEQEIARLLGGLPFIPTRVRHDKILLYMRNGVKDKVTAWENLAKYTDHV